MLSPCVYLPVVDTQCRIVIGIPVIIDKVPRYGINGPIEIDLFTCRRVVHGINIQIEVFDRSHSRILVSQVFCLHRHRFAT